MPTTRTRIAVGLVSLAVILLELTLMRALSLRFWNHFAHMVVGVALLGFGASGTLLTLCYERLRHTAGSADFCEPAPGRAEARPQLTAPGAARRGGRAQSRNARPLITFVLCMAFSLSALLTPAIAKAVPLDVQYLAWDLFQVVNILAIELLMFVPFCIAATAVGIVLMDRPERVGGHYAANLVGSGVGAVAAVLLMYIFSTRGCLVTAASAAYLAGMLVAPWGETVPGAVCAKHPVGRPGKRFLTPFPLVTAAVVGAALVLAGWLAPLEPAVSQYKMLSLVKSMPDTEVIHRTEGPLGRIDVVSGPSLHHTPGLSLQYTGTVPGHVLVITDGDQTSAVYECRDTSDWAFMDHTVGAAAYHLRPSTGSGRPEHVEGRQHPKALVIGAGGGVDIGLALFGGSREVVALEMDPQMINLMTGPLARRGGNIYQAPGVRVVNKEARGYLASTDETFDVIQLPPVDAFGASGAGLYAAQESYLYTVESFEAMIDRLNERGVLCVARWARTPPRDGLKIFDTAVQASRRRDLDPSEHLVMIRSWATVAVLFFKKPITRDEAEAVRSFCEERGFDLCYLPGLEPPETNRFHVLDRPYYFEGAEALAGPEREEFLEEYPFAIEAATDDRPYFFHFFRARSLSFLREQLGRRSRAYLELGLVMLVAALVQVTVIAAVMILLPLVARVGRAGCLGTSGSAIRPAAPISASLTKSAGRRAVKPGRSWRLDRRAALALGYFLLLGAGFMLLEMGLLGRLILYLAHPIYSAAAVISSFLVFGGLGSAVASRWRATPGRVIAVAAGGVVLLSFLFLVALGGWLALTQALPVAVRFLIACVTIAPLAFAMGHMFPIGLTLLGESRPELVPWAWAANGFASVVATLATPLVAMKVGFSGVVCVSIACYALAGVLFRLFCNTWRTQRAEPRAP